jgi:hypothetical protein
MKMMLPLVSGKPLISSAGDHALTDRGTLADFWVVIDLGERNGEYA